MKPRAYDEAHEQPDERAGNRRRRRGAARRGGGRAARGCLLPRLERLQFRPRLVARRPRRRVPDRDRDVSGMARDCRARRDTRRFRRRRGHPNPGGGAGGGAAAGRLFARRRSRLRSGGAARGGRTDHLRPGHPRYEPARELRGQFVFAEGGFPPRCASSCSRSSGRCCS